MHGLAARAALMGLLMLRQLGLGPHVEPTAPTGELNQLWEDPTGLERRDLMAGPQLGVMPPDLTQPFTFVSVKTSGFSPGYVVIDASGRKWSVKMGPEAQTEIVASRLLWAVGYHQPSIYYVDRWTLVGGPSPGMQGGARFRPKDGPLKSDGLWSWQKNPFVDTQPFRGLVVMMVLMNSSDLRNHNNVVYTVKDLGEPHHWYVVKDLGATFGATGIYRPVRNDIDAFEHETLLVTDKQGHARKFAYHGLRKELLRVVSAADVEWTCALLGRLTPEQWRDAFAAGGYSDDIAARYIDTLQQRLEAARGVDDTFRGDIDYWVSRHLRNAAHGVKVAATRLKP
jgi:hypothetical protein